MENIISELPTHFDLTFDPISHKVQLYRKRVYCFCGETYCRHPLTVHGFPPHSPRSKNNIVEVTGDFKGSVAKATLVGEVNLAQFDQNIVTFDCIFRLIWNRTKSVVDAA